VGLRPHSPCRSVALAGQYIDKQLTRQSFRAPPPGPQSPNSRWLPLAHSAGIHHVITYQFHAKSLHHSCFGQAEPPRRTRRGLNMRSLRRLHMAASGPCLGARPFLPERRACGMTTSAKRQTRPRRAHRLTGSKSILAGVAPLRTACIIRCHGLAIDPTHSKTRSPVLKLALQTLRNSAFGNPGSFATLSRSVGQVLPPTPIDGDISGDRQGVSQKTVIRRQRGDRQRVTGQALITHGSPRQMTTCFSFLTIANFDLFGAAGQILNACDYPRPLFRAKLPSIGHRKNGSKASGGRPGSMTLCC